MFKPYFLCEPISLIAERTLQHLFSKTITGKTIGLSALKGSDTIHKIKCILQDKEGLSPDQQMLTYRGQVLTEYKTLDQCRIEDYSLVNFLLVPPGQGMYIPLLLTKLLTHLLPACLLKENIASYTSVI